MTDNDWCSLTCETSWKQPFQKLWEWFNLLVMSSTQSLSKNIGIMHKASYRQAEQEQAATLQSATDKDTVKATYAASHTEVTWREHLPVLQSRKPGGSTWIINGRKTALGKNIVLNQTNPKPQAHLRWMLNPELANTFGEYVSTVFGA